MRTPNINDIGTSAALLYNGGGTVNMPVMLLIQNLGASDLYIGGADVTSSTGIKVGVDKIFPLDVFGGDDVYGVTASGTADVRILIAGE